MTGHRLDFLGIGAPRSGSTWLWAALRRHPEIWLPPRKELHWFDASYRYPTPRYLAGRSPWERVFGLRAHNRDFKRRFAGDTLRALRAGDLASARWLWRYYLGTYDDADYLRLFPARAGILNGEITPSYGLLELDDVRRVHRVAPDARIVLMLRDPIERAWSALKYRRVRGRSSSAIATLDDVRARLQSRGQTMRGDYRGTIERWTSVFPREALLIAFYDDVVARPRFVLRELLKGLGVREIDFDFGAAAETRVNPSSDERVPADVAAYLAESYLPMLRDLAYLGGPVPDWIARAERMLAAEPARSS